MQNTKFQSLSLSSTVCLELGMRTSQWSSLLLLHSTPLHSGDFLLRLYVAILRDLIVQKNPAALVFLLDSFALELLLLAHEARLLHFSEQLSGEVVCQNASLHRAHPPLPEKTSISGEEV